MPGKESIARKVAIPIQKSVWQQLVEKLVGIMYKTNCIFIVHV